MSTTKEAGVNSKLAQFRMCLHKDLIKNKYNLEFILDRMNNNINCRVVATHYLQSHYANWIGFTALHFAVSNMNLEAFDILLRHGAELTMKNSTGLTALHQLVENRQCYSLDTYVPDDNFVHSVVSAHIKYNNYENPVNADGLSHFHIACTVNHVDVVKGFLQNGEFIDHVVNANTSAFSGFTPLHFAIKYKAYEVTEVLSLHGANIHIKNAQDMTPLYMALERKIQLTSDIFDLDETSIDKLDKILKFFIEKEDKNEMMNVDWGLSHLHVACTLNDSKIAETYLQKVVNINHAVSIDSPRWPGYTALHFAALCNIGTVKFLMKKGADISIKDAKGATPLDMCTGRYETEDIYAVISMNPNWKNIMLSDGITKLTDLGFAMRDPNEFKTFLEKLAEDIDVSNSPLWPGYTPMHLAVIVSKDGIITGNEDGESPSEEILKYLYKKNPAMLNSKDVHGYTPLHLAFRLKKLNVYRQLFSLLESDANLVDHVDEDGLSYVHIAAATHEPFLIARLLSTSANVNAVYKGQLVFSPHMFTVVYSGATPLHFAISSDDIDVVKVLMKHGADVYAKDVNGITPVHLLLKSLTSDVLRLSPNLRDSVVSGIGLSHLHVACRYNYSEIVQRLLDDGANIDGVITYKPIANASSSRLPYLKRYDGYSPLLMAYKCEFLEGSHYKTVEVLLQRGADIWVKDTEGKAWVHEIIELNTSKYFDLFIKILIKRVDVQTRLKADTGMTDLHIACFTCDSTEIEKLLNDGANVNAQVRSDSPILKGYTPLHIVIHVNEKYDEVVVNRVINILLKAGADVTLQNGNSETVVHAAWGLFHEKSVVKEQTRHTRVNMLLEAQRNFHVNPANATGISHFHIACHICSVGVVQKFLSHGDVDVDRPIDFFYAYVPGTSALHLAAGSDPVLCGVSRSLRTIDLLLKNGANVHVEDAHTPLHVCAHFNSLDLFERIASNEADVNARNVYGNTPLYYYLNSDNASVEGVKTLLRFGCHLNVFNAVTGEGLMSVATCKFPHADVQSFLNVIIINFTQEMEADNLGRTVIHNIISTDSSKISADQYVTLIEQISEANCDVDGQDNSGRTALHMAVEFYNYKGVFGLLMTGADINITDANGKTAFNRDFEICPQCESRDYNGSLFDSDDEFEKTCKHLMTLEVLAFHVKYLQLCGLHVDKQNEELARKEFDRLYNENAQSKEFLGELEMIKSIRIEPHALTLYDFLSENGAVADYPTMSEMKREDINKFFSSSEVGSLREEFPDVAGILQLQYRKARARPELVELAKNAMELLIGFRLPEICSQIIMVLLTNSELKSLIDSMI